MYSLAVTSKKAGEVAAPAAAAKEEEEEHSPSCSCVAVSNGCAVNSDSETEDLDAAVRKILSDRRLKGDEKCLHYLAVLKCYVYKKNPNVNIARLCFEVQENEQGQVSYVITQKPKSYWKYIPSLIGPVVGGLITALLR